MTPTTLDRPRPSHAEVALLSDLTMLLESARELTELAAERDMPSTGRQVRHIANQLDATRTALVQEGETYTPTALAYLDASADRLAAHAAWIGQNVRRAPQYRRVTTPR